MKSKYFKTGAIIGGCLMLILSIGRPEVAAGEKPFSATLTDFKGTVAIIKAGDTTELPVAVNIPVAEGDMIITGAASSVEIMIDDGSLISLGEKTEIRIVELTADNTSKLLQAAIFLRLGRLFANISRFVHRESRFSVRTPTAVAGVRGTDFVVETDDSMQTDVGVFDGEVTVEGLDESGKAIKDSEIRVTPGKQTKVKRFMKPAGLFGFKKGMLRHQQKIRLLRKTAQERRKELRRLIMERNQRHGEMLKKWKKFRLKNPKFKKPPKRRLHKPPKRPIN